MFSYLFLMTKRSLKVLNDYFFAVCLFYYANSLRLKKKKTLICFPEQLQLSEVIIIIW